MSLSFAGAFNLANLFAYFNQTVNSTTLLPTVCPEWQSGSNAAAEYGDIVAYPAARLLIQCIAYAPNGYTCAQAAEVPNSTGVIVDNFWSTSAVDASMDQPVSRLLLDVAMLDMAGQTMLMGMASAMTHRLEFCMDVALATLQEVCQW